MPQPKVRSQRSVVDACAQIARDVSEALPRATAGEANAIEDVWRAEGLGVLLWSLGLVELPPYDRAFATADVVAVIPATGRLREAVAIGRELEVARLWHWRARTAALADDGVTGPPAGYSSFEQLVGATAMRAYERGLLAQPLRGDFRAFGKPYRGLSTPERIEAHSIAYERHQALAWLTGGWDGWGTSPLET